jgi:hypothetical protein
MFVRGKIGTDKNEDEGGDGEAEEREGGGRRRREIGINEVREKGCLWGEK